MKMWRKILVIVSAVTLVIAGVSVWPRHSVSAAAANSVYLSPSATSVQNGNAVVVSVRINPSTAITSATATVAYNASQLQYVSADTSGSAFSIQFTQSQSSGSVAIERGANLGSSVSADSLVETITFKALAGTGTTSLTLSNTTAGDAGTGNTLTFSGVGTTLTLTTPVTPPPTCPAGYTGTYPNCTKPSTGGGSGSTTGTKGNTTNTSSGATTNTSATQPASQPPSSTPVTVGDKKVGYTNVSITITSPDPTKVYIRYGVNGVLNLQTPVTDFGTSHVVTLDPNMVVPGETYSYAVVATNQKGVTSQTQPATLQTKGITVTVKAVDKNNKPLANKKITLHSNPQTATSDAKGVITFTNVAPGTHHVIYSAGKQTYDQQIEVTNSVEGSGDAQTATPQSFSIVYNLTQSALPMGVVWGGVAVVVVIVLAVLGKTGRLGFAYQFRRDKSVPLVTAPIVVGGNSSAPQTIVNSEEPQKTEVERQLSAIPEPDKPQPGMTVAAPPNETATTVVTPPNETEETKIEVQ